MARELRLCSGLALAHPPSRAIEVRGRASRHTVGIAAAAALPAG